MDDVQSTYVAFAGPRRIGFGDLLAVVTAAKRVSDAGEHEPILVFDEQTGRQLDLNLHGSLAQVLERELPAPTRAGPGRPRLGVSSREVSLLPRHWEWLEQQPSGASAALRRLVEAARKSEPDKQSVRRACESAGRFMTAVAGNLPNYEEASRALYAGDAKRFAALVRRWPKDVREQTERMAAAAFRSG